MIILSTYYNPTNDPRTFANYCRFRRNLNMQGISDGDIYVAELAYEGQQFVADPYLRVHGDRQQLVPWQKESLLNALVETLPHKNDQPVAWLDADILFMNDDWYEHTENLYENKGYDVVQLFGEAYYMDAWGSLDNLVWGAAHAMGCSKPDFDNYAKSQPGLAWSCRSIAFLQKHKLFEYMITGSGDTVAFRAFTGCAKLRLIYCASPQLRVAIQDYCTQVQKDLAGKKPGWVPGSVVHLYHGPLANRRYIDRWCALEDFNPHADIAPRISGGPLYWGDGVNIDLRTRATELLASSRL